MRRFARVGRLVVVCCALVSATLPARADDKAAAETLFQEGKRLVAQQRYAEACAKFAASFEAEPSIGAMLNLARCHEQTGQTASAWAEYVEAEALARRAGEKKTADAASAYARELDAKLIRLTIRVSERPPGLSVKRNDAAVPEASLGVAIPVDPGDHRIELTAPGYRSWSTRVTASASSPSLVVHVPALQPESAAPRAPAPVVTPPAADAPGPSALKVAGLVVGSAGVLGLAVGIGFGIAAADGGGDLERACPEPAHCGSAGLELRDDLATKGDVSTVAFAVGSVLLVGGATLLLIAPSSSRGRATGAVRASFAPSGVALHGTF